MISCPQPVHLVLISHSHFDHLSQRTTEALWSSPTHQPTVHWLVPLGLKSFFLESVKIPAERVIEMDWWEEVGVSLGGREGSQRLDETKSGGKEEDMEDSLRLRIACTPSQHGSGRGMGDQNKSLWCSWVVGLEDDSSNPSSPAQIKDMQSAQPISLTSEASLEDEGPHALATDDELIRTHAIWNRMAYKVFFAGSVG